MYAFVIQSIFIKVAFSFNAGFVFQSSSGGSLWNGHRCFTDISDPTMISLGHFAGLADIEKQVNTTLIAGDLDDDHKVFNSVVRAFKEQSEDVTAGFKYYNTKNEAVGTHVKLLLVAAMKTEGDMLELGMGTQSTKLLHDIFKEDNKLSRRMLVSVESDPAWFEDFKHLSSSFHQLLLLPDCNEKNDVRKETNNNWWV